MVSTPPLEAVIPWIVGALMALHGIMLQIHALRKNVSPTNTDILMANAVHVSQTQEILMALSASVMQASQGLSMMAPIAVNVLRAHTRCRGPTSALIVPLTLFPQQ
jgi:hypothetical protein